MGKYRTRCTASDYGLRWSVDGGEVKFEQGAVGSAHSHYHTQASFVASGKFEVTVGGEKKILSAGDGFYVAPDTTHGVVCLEAGVLVDTFSPMRATFIGMK